MFNLHKKLPLPTLVWIWAPLLFSIVGLADWGYETRYGNEIHNPGNGPTLILHNAKHRELNDLIKWYYYHAHIVGKYDLGYFIAEERTGVLHLYKDQSQWENDLDLHRLRPSFWTRWYTDHYPISKAIAIWLILLFPLTILLIFLVSRFIYNTWKKDRFDWRKRRTQVLLFIISCLLCYYFTYFYTDSF